jgi:FdhD protein
VSELPLRMTRRPGPSTRVRVVEVRAATPAQGTAQGSAQELAPRRQHREDRLATEEPLEVRLAWPDAAPQVLAVTMRTPGDDFDLAVGFVLGEGLALPEDVVTVAYCTDESLRPEQDFNVVTVRLSRAPRRDLPSRAGAVSAACGVCGKDSIDAVLSFGGRPVLGDMVLTAGVVATMPERLRDGQRIFDRTGGLHAAGLFSSLGAPLLVREDIGRHNAVDKVVGALALERSPTAGLALCVSGRAGFEIVQKAVLAGLPVVVAVGAPSSLAVECAERFGVTLVGFTRPERFVVYSRGERVGV